MKRFDIGFSEAYRLAMANMPVLGETELPVPEAAGFVLASPVSARVDSPSVTASLKDGFAVVSNDLLSACPKRPASLEIIGCVAAGHHPDEAVGRGRAMRILTGAPLPPGADAVLAEEFSEVDGTRLLAYADALPGRNVQAAGDDVASGEILAESGSLVTPRLITRLTAGGVFRVRVRIKPKVGLLATGSEIILPGGRPARGKLFASNVAFQQAWLFGQGIETRVCAAGDSPDSIREAIGHLDRTCDVLITSGGAWKGERDLMVRVLDSLGWEMDFHRTRMGPGKSMAAGTLSGKPVFCLPGGPASNETAFTMIALPAVLKMAGHRHAPFLQLCGRLGKAVSGRIDWTQFVACELEAREPEPLLRPAKLKGRMGGMGRSPIVVVIPEGKEEIREGARVSFLCLDKSLFEWEISQTPSPFVA
jgi:molybdopterin molybdotransferase